jgi:hypothetical protein
MSNCVQVKFGEVWSAKCSDYGIVFEEWSAKCTDHNTIFRALVYKMYRSGACEVISSLVVQETLLSNILSCARVHTLHIQELRHHGDDKSRGCHHELNNLYRVLNTQSNSAGLVTTVKHQSPDHATPARTIKRSDQLNPGQLTKVSEFCW